LIRWAIEEPFRRVIRGADAIFALSDREQGLLGGLGVPADRVHVVTNGVNEFYLKKPVLEELDAARRKFGLSTKPILLFMGSLHGYKGLDVFLRSLGGITEPFQAVVAGQFKHEQERTKVLRESGLPDAMAESVIFTNAVSNEELRALYSLSSLFVYPTKGDTLPLVVLEAMACGLPVVSTSIGGLPFMVGPAEGVLVGPGDAAAVARAVDSLLKDPIRRGEMGRSAHAKVLSRFRWDAAAQKAFDGYERVLHSRVVTRPAPRIPVTVLGRLTAGEQASRLRDEFPTELTLPAHMTSPTSPMEAEHLVKESVL
jgi:glycosyltransferase involved in cell wall biosynthesis